MRKRVPMLNPEKDMSAAHAFDESRMLPRAALELFGVDLPWGEHPDDDMFIEIEYPPRTRPPVKEGETGP